MSERFSTSANKPLLGEADLAGILADTPSDVTLKGMFFFRYVDEALPNLKGVLDAPPPNGKYHAFEAYPLRDYIRVCDYIARARFPGSTREALRLLARGEVDVFAESTLGKVTFSMLKNPEVALVRYPELIGMLMRAPPLKATKEGPNRVKIACERYVGSTELQIGVLEGLAMAFDVTPTVDVDLDNARRGSFTISW